MNTMAGLFLDFQKPHRRIGISGMVLLLIGLAVTTFLGAHLFSRMQTLNIQETRYAIATRHSGKSQHKVSYSAAELQKLRAEIKDANSVMLQLSLPWNGLFKSIAGSQQTQVALLSITPDVSRKSIKISGEAKNLDVLLEYLQKLQKADSLRSVYLEKHQIELRSAQRPVRFTIIANWDLAP